MSSTQHTQTHEQSPLIPGVPPPTPAEIAVLETPSAAACAADSLMRALGLLSLALDRLREAQSYWRPCRDGLEDVDFAIKQCHRRVDHLLDAAQDRAREGGY